MSRPGQVKVCGTCKDGHVTETTSAPGRVTWQGECAHAGCELTVHAKRIPRERQQQQAKSGPAESPQRSTTPEVREVSYDVPHPARQQHEGQSGSGDQQLEQRPEPEQPPGGGPVQPAPGDAGPGDRQQRPEQQQPERPEQPGAELVGARRERPKRRRRLNPFAGLRFESPLDR